MQMHTQVLRSFVRNLSSQTMDKSSKAVIETLDDTHILLSSSLVFPFYHPTAKNQFYEPPHPVYHRRPLHSQR